MEKIKQVVMRAGIAALPLAALFIAAPSPAAHAQYGDVFQALMSSIGGDMATALTAIQATTTVLSSVEQETKFPLAVIQQTQGVIQQVENGPRNAVTAALNTPLGMTAQTPQAQQLESIVMTPLTGNVGSLQSSISSAYQGVYGSSLTFNANTSTNFNGGQASAQLVDMLDATAQNNFTAAAVGDSSSQTTLEASLSLANGGITTAPGTESQVIAQSMVTELTSIAEEHKMYAAQLRNLAMQLTTAGVQAKEAATSNSNLMGGQGSLFNVKLGAGGTSARVNIP